MICDFEKSNLYIVTIDLNNLRSLEVPADLEWAMIVAYNRGKVESIAGTELYEKYNAVAVRNDRCAGEDCGKDGRILSLNHFF